MADFITDLRTSTDEVEEVQREIPLPLSQARVSVLRVLQAKENLSDGGELTRQWIPQAGIEHVNPFQKFGWARVPQGLERPGLEHHEGVEIINFLAQGGYRHQDQHRLSGALAAGSVEHLMAGAGIWHQEQALKDGGFEIFQIILSLPEKTRKLDSVYQAFRPDQMPFLSKGDHWLRFLAGGAAPLKTATPLILVLSQVEANAKVNIPGAEGRQALVCMIQGKGLVGQTLVREGELAVLSSSEELEISAGDEPLTLLLASARPVKA